MFLQITSGIALGLLLGTLVGFSQSPVTATVIAALTGVLALFFGFNAQSDADGRFLANSRVSAGRLCGFGFACTIALILSLYARTHDTLSIPLKTQISTLISAGYTEDEAHAWGAYKNAGILLRMNGKAIADKDDKRTQTAASVLFADPGVDPCFIFSSKRIANVDDRISAMRDSGQRFASLADSISTLDKTRKESIMKGMNDLFCPGGTHD
jgi:hypothetical protein